MASQEQAIAQQDPNNIITTRVFLSNIHCPSCVKTIDDTLKHFQNDVISVSTSTVTQTVTVRHSPVVSSATVARALYDAGFDVRSLYEQRGHSRASMFALSWLTPNADINRNSTTLSTAFQEFSCGLLQSPEHSKNHTATHSVYCKQCAMDDHSPPYREDSQARLTTISESSSSEDLDSVLESVAIAEVKDAGKYKLVMSVHGMTCSSCVGRVAEVLKEKPYVEEVNVNLLNESATLIIQDRGKADELVEEVEDIGYEAAVESCEALSHPQKHDTNSEEEEETNSRSITIKVDGMHCEHCPEKIVKALQQLHSGITIDKSPTIEDPLLTITYTPQPPTLTIRQILAYIWKADSALSPDVYTMPSLEERARKLQARHRLGIAIRLAISVVLAIPTFAFGVVIMDLLPTTNSTRIYWTQPDRSTDSYGVNAVPKVQWPLLAFSTIVYFFAADLFHRRALKELYMMWRPGSKVPLLRRFYRFGSMDMLLSLGTTIAYIGSIVVLALSAGQDSMNDMDTTTYFDAVVFLTMFLLMGRLLEAYGKMQTADAVNSLGKLRPREALLLITNTKSEIGTPAEQVPVEHLEVGDVLVIPTGSSPPCDGVVVWGTSTFDESSLTGESRPVSKNVTDEIFAGTINLSNSVHIKIMKTVGVSFLDQIIDTVREGQSKRAPIERIADILTGYFVPLIVLIAVCDWLIWLLLGYAGSIPYVTVGTGGWTIWSLQFAIAVLVVACPCGIGLAAPTALFVGTGIAAKHGILVRGGGEAFQEASELDCIVFDKTGTITEGGSPKITDHHFFAENKHILPLIMAIESNSTHPLAIAVKDFCSQQAKSTKVDLLKCDEISGRGMIGKFVCPESDGIEAVFIGNEILAEEHNVFIPPEAIKKFQEWSRSGKTVLFAGSKHADSTTWTLDLMMAASDPIRPGSANIIRLLKKQGVDIWLLSG
ncbi:hypothetical protein MRB53_038568 [Persea americana]|nr:hypothetical protein MRB53_038568 [Persea americana]